MTIIHDIDDTQTAVDIEGSGPPLLLMHGLKGGRRMLDRLQAELASTFQVITYDQRDSGETRNPARPYDLKRLADDAALLIERLGFDKAHVFGTSFGGRIAQALALEHPDRVDRLVLGSTWPLPMDMGQANPAGLARFVDVRSRLPESASEFAEFFVPASFLRDHPELRQLLVGMPNSPDRAQRRADAANTSVGDASGIRAETLLLAGEVDQMVPASVTISMQNLISRSRAVVLPNVGHATWLQAPADLAGHIRRFLRPEGERT